MELTFGTTLFSVLQWASWPFCYGWPALHLSPGHVGDQNCGCPLGDADISAVNIGTMFLKAYIGNHSSLFDLIIKRLMDS